MNFLRHHHPFSFSWPWPATEGDDESWNCGQKKRDIENERGRRTLVEEEAQGVVVQREDIVRGIAHHRKRRRRMAPVLSPSRTQLLGRQETTPTLPTLSPPISLSVDLPIPSPSGGSGEGDDGEGESSSASSSSSLSSSSVSSSASSFSLSQSSSSSSSASSSNIITSSSSSFSSSSSESSSSSSSPTISSFTSSSATSSSSISSETSELPQTPPPTSSSEPPPPSSSSEPPPSSISSTYSSISSTYSSISPSEPSPPPFSATSTPYSTISFFTPRPQSTLSLLIPNSTSILAPTTTFLFSTSIASFSLLSTTSSISTTASVLPQDEGNSLARNTGAIIGISLAAFVVLLALVICLFFIVRSKNRRATPTYLRSDNDHGHAGGRMSALRNLLGGSPSFGRSTASSLGTNSSRGALAYGSPRERGLMESRPVMVNTITRGSGISLGSQFSLEEVPIEGSSSGPGSRLNLEGGIDGRGNMGMEMRTGMDIGINGHAGEMSQVGIGIPVAGATAAAVGTGAIMAGAGVGIALTTRDSQVDALASGNATGLGRSVSGRAPILYKPSIASGIPPSSYHWKATSPSIPLPISPGQPPLSPGANPGRTTPQPTRISPIPNSSNHSYESAISPSSEAAGVVSGYYALASSSGHGHGMSSSSDIPSDASSEGVGGRTSRNKPNRPNSFAVAFANLGKGKSNASSETTSSSSGTNARSSKSPKGKDKESDFDFGFLGRLRSGSKGKRMSSSNFGRGFGKEPVHVGMPVSGMSFTASTFDGDRLAPDDYVGEDGMRVRPSSLLNPPNPYIVPSPMSGSFAAQQASSPPNIYTSPSFSPSQYYAPSPSVSNKRRHSLPSMMLVPATPPQEPAPSPSLPSAKSPYAPATSASATLPSARAKRGRSQLYISNDTRWAESVADSFYDVDPSEGHDQQTLTVHDYQEANLQPSPTRLHSPNSPSSQYSQPSASHTHSASVPNISSPHSAPFARPPHAFPQSQSPDRSSYASNGSNGTDSSINSRPGVPEGLLRPDLRTFVLGLRSQDAVNKLREVYEDEIPGEYPPRRDWDGQSIGSLRDHVDYSRPIGALMSNRMPSTTTFHSDHDP